jgi:hypothetical protein
MPAWPSNTNPNSPAVASASAVRMDVPAAAPKPRANTKIKPNLKATGTISASMTQPKFSITTRTFSSMPIVTKNKPRSTSRKGLMSSSTRCLNSVSEISMPATNAPSASDSPAASVIHANASATNSRFSVKSSCDLRRATM